MLGNKHLVRDIGENLKDISYMVSGYEDDPESMIDFTSCDQPLLIIAGADDKCVPLQVVQYTEEVIKKSSKTNCEVCIYDGLGHLVDLPFSPPTSVTNHVLFPRPIKALMGGTNVLNHGQSQEQSWLKILHFLKNTI